MKATTIKQENVQRQVMLRDMVTAILGISQEKYYQVQFETAERYMLERCNEDHVLVLEFLREPQFWAWWRNQYSLVDEYFAIMYEEFLTTDPIQRYIDMHLNIKGQPDRMLWQKIEDSYMHAINSIIKTKVNGHKINQAPGE